MAGLLAAWVLFPLVALGVCLALGLLVERASGGRLPGALLLPVGMAALIAVTQLPTYLDETAELTVPLVVLLAVAGLVLGRHRLRGLRPDPWLTGALAGVFGVFAAPIVLTGEATFAGYTLLGDTANHFLGADAMLRYGRDFASLPPSTYEFALQGYFGINAYPAGGPTAVGALMRLVFMDVAWVFQPFLSLLVVLMGAAFWALITPHVASTRTRAAVVFVTSQPALVLAYALQGSVKEIGTAFTVAVFAALVPLYAHQAEESPWRALPLGVAAGATVAIVGPAAAIWLVPLSVAAVVAALWGRLRIWRTVALAAAIYLAVALGLSYQALLTLATYVEVAGGVVTAQQEVGNLLGPLDPLQKYGVWLIGDYRNEPLGTAWTLTKIFAGFVVGGVALGAIWALRRRAWAPAAFVGVSLLAYLYVTDRGSPWADGKALMIVSPAVVLAAGLGAASLKPALARYGLLAVIAAGVLWSNAYQYHDVWPAPRDRLEELADVGERIAGEGPTLYTEFEEFAKHFLREGAPEGSSEGYQRRYELAVDRAGARMPLGFTADLDRFTLEYLTYFRTIVRRRGFEGSVPPATYRRVYQGDYYEIWQRPESPDERIVEHLPLGGLMDPAAPVDCAEAERLGGVAEQSGGRLVAYERAVPLLFLPHTVQEKPASWFSDPAEEFSLYVAGSGRLTGEIEVPADGVYDVWMQASTVRPATVRIDGRELAGTDWQLNGRGTSQRIGRVELEAGRHTIEIERSGGTPLPGDGGYRRLGPVALTPPDRGGRLVEVPADEWRELCGRTADWVEVVA